MYVSDNAVKAQAILVDPRGRPIVIKEPRKIGFQPPKEKK